MKHKMNTEIDCFIGALKRDVNKLNYIKTLVNHYLKQIEDESNFRIKQNDIQPELSIKTKEAKIVWGYTCNGIFDCYLE